MRTTERFRLVSITNAGSERREIELTSYAELVLTTPATDDAHPAFAKMFVETEYLSEFGCPRCDTPPAFSRRAGDLGRPYGCRAGRSVRSAAIRNGSSAFPRARTYRRDGHGHEQRDVTDEHVGTVLDPVSRCAIGSACRPAGRASRSGRSSPPRGRPSRSYRPSTKTATAWSGPGR